MANFESISTKTDISIPERKTAYSAGYDIEVAEDIVIPPYDFLKNAMTLHVLNTSESLDALDDPKTLDEMSEITKKSYARPTLVPTGLKVKLEKNQYLQLLIRSSCPLKHWLILANSVGIIDSDYYNNPDNEGHIYFQIINLSPFPIILKKGDIIGQGIISEYITTEDDAANGIRLGGFGSTSV